MKNFREKVLDRNEAKICWFLKRALMVFFELTDITGKGVFDR